MELLLKAMQNIKGLIESLRIVSIANGIFRITNDANIYRINNS